MDASHAGWFRRSLPGAVVVVALAAVLGRCTPEAAPPPEDTTAQDTMAQDTMAQDTMADGAVPVLRFVETLEGGDYGVVEVSGVDPGVLRSLEGTTPNREAWNAFLAVYTGPEVPADSTWPSMLGSYELTGERVRFRPRYPLVAGLSYTARLDLARLYARHGGGLPVPDPPQRIATFTVPPADTEPTTVVTQVYPSAGVLPMNLLRFYIHFSAPMRRGAAYAHLGLYEAETGEAVADPFLVIPEELWDPEQQRFTLLLDPGRIKRGVGPNLQRGLALQAGKRYRLVVDPAWPDAGGKPLKSGFEKAFDVAEPDRTLPAPEGWELTPPLVGTEEPVSVVFPEPLDHALLGRMLVVKDAAGTVLPGRIEITDEETRWLFYPTRIWQAGRYVLEAESVLEDLAGNNLRHPFDADLSTQSVDRSAEQEPYRLPFTVAPGANH